MNKFLQLLQYNPVVSLAELVAFVPSHPWKYMIGYAVYLGLCALLLIASFIFRKRIAAELVQRFQPLFINNLVFGLIIFFFRYQEIPLLGMDIWRFLQYLLSIAWIVYSVVTYRKARVVSNFSQAVAERKNKYLPKPKAA